MKEPFNISVAIPVYNGADTIETCLTGLLQQVMAPFEVIVVDNGSSDGTPEKVRRFTEAHPELRLVLALEQRPGPSAARNRAVRICRGEVIAFTDADCVPDAEWILDLSKAFREEEVGVVAGTIRGYRPANLIQEFLSLYTLRGFSRSRIFHRFTLTEGGFPTANLAVRREVFDAVGGFDEEMRFGEDHDFCARVMEAGYPIRYIEGGVVRHIHRGSLSSLVRQSYSYGRGHAGLLRKYHRGVFLVEIVGRSFRREPCAGRVWVQAVSADKKMLFLVFLSVFLRWGFCLPILYGLYLSGSVLRKAKGTEVSPGIFKSIAMAVLLLIKSFAMTLGRWRGSFDYHVLCL